MSIKTEKTLLVFELKKDGVLFSVTVDPNNPVAQVLHQSPEAQIQFPLALSAFPMLTTFIGAIGSDPAILEMLTAQEAARNAAQQEQVILE